MNLFYRSRTGRSGIDHREGKTSDREADIIIYAGSLVNPQVLSGQGRKRRFTTAPP